MYTEAISGFWYTFSRCAGFGVVMLLVLIGYDFYDKNESLPFLPFRKTLENYKN
jgi:hypothetical protein